MSLKKRVSLNIARYRVQAKMSKKQFAKLLKANSRFSTYLEDSKNPPNLTLETLERVAKVLNCTPGNLLAGRQEDEVKVPDPIIKAAQLTLEEVIKNVRSVSELLEGAKED